MIHVTRQSDISTVSLTYVTLAMHVFQQSDMSTVSLSYVTLVTHVSEQSPISTVSLPHVNVQLMSYDYMAVEPEDTKQH